jgi:hypothetical protein
MWAVEPEQFDAARESLDQISAQWDVALARLKDYVER